MNRKTLVPAAALAFFTLSACGDGDNEPGPGGVSEGEAAALDDAAEIIEARRLPENALPDSDSTAPLPPAPPPSQADQNAQEAPEE